MNPMEFIIFEEIEAEIGRFRRTYIIPTISDSFKKWQAHPGESFSFHKIRHHPPIQSPWLLASGVVNDGVTKNGSPTQSKIIAS